MTKKAPVSIMDIGAFSPPLVMRQNVTNTDTAHYFSPRNLFGTPFVEYSVYSSKEEGENNLNNNN